MAAPDQGNEGAGAAGGAAVGDDADGVAQLQEITDYFKFSVKPDATYRGTVLFRLSTKGKERYDVSVRICDDGSVVVWEGNPPDGKVSVTLDMPKADFLRVYSGTASAAAVSKMVLSGRLYVHGFAYRGLKNFASSFDYTSECWKRFYAARDAEAAKQKAEEEAKAAAARAQADDEASKQVGGTKVTAPDATARAKGVERQREHAARLLAEMLGDQARADLQRVLDSKWAPNRPGLVPDADAWREAAAAAAAAGTASVSAPRRVREALPRLRASVFRKAASNDSKDQAGGTGSPKLGPALSVYLADPSAVERPTQARAEAPAARVQITNMPPLDLVLRVCEAMVDVASAAQAEGRPFVDVLAQRSGVRFEYSGLIAVVPRQGKQVTPSSMPHMTVATLPGSGPVESRVRFVVRAPDYWRQLLDSSASAAERAPSTAALPAVASPAPASPLAVPATTARGMWLPNPWWLDPMSTSLSPTLPIPFLPGPATHPASVAATAPSRAKAPRFSLLPCCDAMGFAARSDAAPSLRSGAWNTWALPSHPLASVARAVSAISDAVRAAVQPAPASGAGTGAGAGASAPAGSDDDVLPSRAQGHGVFPILASWLPIPNVALGDTEVLSAAADLARAAAAQGSRTRSGHARWRKLRNYVAEVRQTATEKAPPHRSHFGTVMVDPKDVDHEWGRGLNRFMPTQPAAADRNHRTSRSWGLEEPSGRGATPPRAAAQSSGNQHGPRDLQDEAEALGVPPVGEEFG